MKTLAFLLAFFFVLLISHPVKAQQQVLCESLGTAPNRCVYNSISNGPVTITVAKQISQDPDSACEMGETYHYDSNFIYVEGGCSAVFNVTTDASPHAPTMQPGF